MRLRFVVAFVAVVAAVASFAVVQRRSAAADEAEEQAKIERGMAIDANTALLDELPALDGVRFLTFEEVGAPVGGSGRQWHITYSAASPEVAEEMVRRHADALASWPEVVDDPPERVTARDGKRWVNVYGGPIGEDRRPGVTVTVNALDGEVLPAPRRR